MIHLKQEGSLTHEEREVAKHSFLRVVPGSAFSCLAGYSFQLEQSRLSCALEVFFAGLLTGTVSLSTLNTHSQMVLTKASSAAFKIALR